MRILHVTPFYAPAWAYGGIPRAVHALARSQAIVDGVTVDVVTTDACDAISRHRPTKSGDARYFRNLSNALAYHAMLPLPVGLRRHLRQTVRSYDVAHLHGCRHVLNELFVRTAEHPPYVLSPHGTLPRIERRILAKAVYDSVFGRRVLSEASMVLALTQAEASHFAGVDTARIAVLPNIVEGPGSVSAADLAGFRSRFGVDRPYLLYLGKLTPRKRVDLLIRAFANLSKRDHILVIAGNDMGTEPELRRLVRRLDLGPSVIFTGLLIGTARAAALAGAELLVYPGEHEVFGLVPFEGLLAGTVPVVSDDSGCAELVREGRCGYCFECGSVESLRHTIEAALAETSARAEMLSRARAFLDRFAAQKVAAVSLEIYRQAIGI